MIMSCAEFAGHTGVKLQSAFLKRKSSDALIGIHQDLGSLEGGKYPKFNPEARWDFMLKLAGRCEIYLKAKEARGRNLTKQKHRCIDDLANQLVTQMWRERFKSDMYGNKATQFDQIRTGLPMGRNNPHHGKVKFELALGGKAPVVNGQSLWSAAQQAQINLTGNDRQDAYILRSWLKQLARSNQLDSYSLSPLEYADSVQRTRYLLSFDQATCSQGTTPFDTTRSFTPGEEGAVPFVVSEGGEWYAKANPAFDGSFHHSSFLSGTPVILAGTIRVAAGTLQYVSNSSGHYAPKLSDLVNGARQLRHCGLDQAGRHKVSILFSDFDGILGTGNKFLFPYAAFVSAKGMVPNSGNYAVRDSFGELFWENPSAPRPHHCATVGPNGTVVFPP